MDQYSTPFSITSQFAFCGLPLRLDTYRGCGFQCSYCFARNRGGNGPGNGVRSADASQIVRTLEYALSGRTDGVIAEFLQRRPPIHFGGMSDPFQPAEERHRVTASVLRTLARYEYPTVLSTRGDIVASPPYIGLLRDFGKVIVQFSFSTSRDGVAACIEPHSTRPSRLFRAMERLSSFGVPVACRWQPYIPGVTEAPEEFVPRIADTGCRHLAFEHLKLPVEQGKPLWQEFAAVTGRDFLREYRSAGALRDGREIVLPPERKLTTILEAREHVHRKGMTFGAADNEFQYLSDTSCCCSGVDQFAGFENWFRHQVGFAVRRSQGRCFDYRIIAKEWAPSGSVDRYLNSRCRLSRLGHGRGTIQAHVRARWNRLNAPGSPATFFGIIPASPTKGSRGVDVRYKWGNEARALLGR